MHPSAMQCLGWNGCVRLWFIHVGRSLPGLPERILLLIERGRFIGERSIHSISESKLTASFRGSSLAVVVHKRDGIYRRADLILAWLLLGLRFKGASMDPELNVVVKHVEKQLVAGIRRRYGVGESALAGVLDLLEQIGDRAIGAPMYMEHGYDETLGFDVEVCIPVADAIDSTPIQSRVLPRETMLCVTHRGPYAGRDGVPGLGETWNALWGFIVDRKLSPEDPNANPTRVIVRKGRDAAVDAFEVEIQIPYHFPVWIERFRAGLVEVGGTTLADEVMDGVDDLGDGLDHEAVRAWVRDAMERLDRSAAQQKDRERALSLCSHTPVPALVRRLRQAFQEAGSLEKFLDVLHDLQSEEYWREDGQPKNVLFTEKLPFEITAEEYANASDPVNRRYYYCHCALVKEAIRSGERLSLTFCNCGAGFYVRMWEAITDRLVRVEVLETVLGGADRCRFAIHLADDIA